MGLEVAGARSWCPRGGTQPPAWAPLSPSSVQRGLRPAAAERGQCDSSPAERTFCAHLVSALVLSCGWAAVPAPRGDRDTFRQTQTCSCFLGT